MQSHKVHTSPANYPIGTLTLLIDYEGFRVTAPDILRSKALPTVNPARENASKWLLNNLPFLGLAKIVRGAYEGNSLEVELQFLKDRLAANYQDSNALMDAALILLVNNQVTRAVAMQKAATRLNKNFQVRFGSGSDLRVLVLATVGDLMANTPIEFLLEQSNVEIIYHYVDHETVSLDDAPTHDIAFLAVGQSSENEPTLQNLKKLLRFCIKPVINGDPDKIGALTRLGVFRSLSSEVSITAVPGVEQSRSELTQFHHTSRRSANIWGSFNFPIVARPLGTHAGKGMKKINDQADLDLYLLESDEPHFHICPFINYQSADGYFRKQRIVLIDGIPYPSHQATSKNWMVHYLNADMDKFEDRRTDEANWFANFHYFTHRHQKAFKALHERIGLDYFGIDCAEAQDGTLLVFEVDVAMIVHALDSELLFPYKRAAMNSLCSAFLDFLKRRSKLSLTLVRREAF